jgi:DNA-binding transcriptional MerR regulator
MINETLYTASRLVNTLRRTVNTLSFYETKSFMNLKWVVNRRVHNYIGRTHMPLILHGKRIGFSLNGIRKFLNLYDTNDVQTPPIQFLVSKLSNPIKQLTEQQSDINKTFRELKNIQSIAVETLKKVPKIKWSEV